MPHVLGGVRVGLMDHPNDRVIHFTQLSVGFQILLICIFFGSCAGGSVNVRGDDSAELRSLQEEVRGLRQDVEGLRRSSP
jgi:hypothetical protein